MRGGCEGDGMKGYVRDSEEVMLDQIDCCIQREMNTAHLRLTLQGLHLL